MPTELWSLIEWYIAFLATAVAYAFFTNRIRSATMVLRCAFADQAERLLAHRSLPKEDETSLEFMLDHATDGRVPWLLAFLLPFYIVMKAFGLIKPHPKPNNETIAKMLQLTHVLWWLSILGLSPLAGLILIIETIILILVSYPRQMFGIVGLLVPIDRFFESRRISHS